MAKQMNNWMENLKGYTKRSFAEKKATEYLGNLDVRWFIYRQENGKFAPVVIANNKVDVGLLVHLGFGVLN